MFHKFFFSVFTEKEPVQQNKKLWISDIFMISDYPQFYFFQDFFLILLYVF